MKPPCYFMSRNCSNSDFGSTVDEELAAKIGSELSLEMMESHDEMPLALKEFLDNSMFEVISRCQTRHASFQNTDLLNRSTTSLERRKLSWLASLGMKRESNRLFLCSPN